MTIPIDEVAASLREVQTELVVAGKGDAAARIDTALNDFHSTTTEALIDYYESLRNTKKDWMEVFSQVRSAEVERLMERIHRMTDLR